MRIVWIHIRYYPPGIILEYAERSNKKTRKRVVDLLDFSYSTDLDDLMTKFIERGLVPQSSKMYLYEALKSLQNRAQTNSGKKFSNVKSFRTHIFPASSMAINKEGSRMVTGSLDKTAVIWDLKSGTELTTLSGHDEAILSVDMNNTGDRVVTSSADGSVRYWHVYDIEGPPNPLHAMEGTKRAKLLTVKFSHDNLMCGSGSSDHTAFIHDLTSGCKMYSFTGHSGDVKSIAFDKRSFTLLTASFDGRSGLWDLRSGTLISFLMSHEAEVVRSVFNYSEDYIASCSLDNTVRLWDLRRKDQPIAIFAENNDEVYDVVFDSRGQKLASGGKEGRLTIWDVATCNNVLNVEAHSSPINQVRFSPNGAWVSTAGDDSACKLWHPDTGFCAQTLEGHGSGIMAAEFSYFNDALVTVARDNICRLWH